MENASKALIIAGAILLAILIISLGIMIYNQAAGVVDSTAMDEVAVTSFNKKFTQYEGKNVRGTQVNALLETIVQNNLSNSSDASKQVAVSVYALEWSDTTKKPNNSKITSLNSKALTGQSYEVAIEKDEKSGYVNLVKIMSIY